MNSNGSGTANLVCGTGCGFNFNIQVAPDRSIFNLVGSPPLAGNLLGGGDPSVIHPAGVVALVLYQRTNLRIKYGATLSRTYAASRGRRTAPPPCSLKRTLCETESI